MDFAFQETFPAFVGAQVNVTVTNAAGSTTGPITGLATVDFDPSPIPVPGLEPWAVAWLPMGAWVVALRTRPIRPRSE